MSDFTVQELKKKMEDKEDFVLIDVREQYERDEFNIGGELATLQTTLIDKINELKNNTDQEIVVYCRSGNRSGMAKQLFMQAGFTNVHNLLGGMLAWKDAFPVKQ
jgi:rhodanese-related sulfurtransferase